MKCHSEPCPEISSGLIPESKKTLKRVQGDSHNCHVSELNFSELRTLEIAIQQLDFYLLPCPGNLLIFGNDDQTIGFYHRPQNPGTLLSGGRSEIRALLEGDKSPDEVTPPGFLLNLLL